MEFELEKGIFYNLLRIESIEWSNISINWYFMINKEINMLYDIRIIWKKEGILYKIWGILEKESMI